MNEDAVLKNLEKVEKVTRKLTLWILGIAIFIATIGTTYYVYQYGGYKEYRAALGYLNKFGGNEKDKKIMEFFNPVGYQNLSGGIFAASWNNNLWMWGKTGLIHYSVDKVAKFFIVTKCPQGDDLKPLESLRGEISSDNIPLSALPRDEVFFKFDDWRGRVHAGSYIQVNAALNDKNDLKSVSVFSEFRGPENWVFCNVFWEQQ